MNLLYGRPDVITGLISNGRPERLDGERIIGLFLNAVTVRLDLSGGSWKELVLQTFAAEQTVLPFRRFPIAELQRINHARPLFETAFDFVHFHVYRRLKDRQDIDLTEGHYFEANDMATYTTFMLSADSKRLELHIDYDPERIAEAQVKPMTAYYVRALESIAKDPESRYEREVPLEKGEKELVLRGWNSSQDAYPSSLKVHELFEAWARRLPHEIAVIQGEKRLTYGELDQRASWLASLLRARGLKHQDRLGICLDRSPDMLVALIASMKAGAVYVPLDPAYPAHRLEAMVEDAQPRFVLTEQKFAQLFQATSSSLFLLDEPATALATDPEESSPTQGSSADLAYVIYTSGSTGKPKGVQVKHRSVVNLLCSVADRLGVTAKDQLLAVTTLSFDIAALELFLPLITGGKVYLCPREIAADGRLLEKLVTTTRPSLMQATPATWQLLVEAGWQGNKDLKVISGGAALKQRLADQLLDRAVDVWNFYGPTETTIWSSCWKVSRYSPISIGGPLANTCLYILDQHRQPVPIGTVGELYIGGDGVALGYLNRPELTAERFMLDPFATGGEARMYRTGDLARHLPDGNIVCLGRIDQQVKIHGFRIEPAEIEGVLREYPSVADAVVTAREDATGSNRLVAYIVSRNGLPDLGELRHFVGSRVPYYMVPSHVVCLDHFPMTPNGKVDLLNLPPPEQGRLRPTGYTPPRTDLETRVSQIWGEVLAVEQVGAEDNFFELGGDSLSATRAFSRINDAFGTEVALQELFEHPTLSDFARVLKERGTVPVQSQWHRIPRQPRRVPVA